MNITMDVRQNTFTLVDVIKIVGTFVLGAIAWATLSIGQSNTREDVGEIRSTQIENTKKNEIRDQLIDKRLGTIELNQRLLEQRMDSYEKNKK